MPFDVAADRGDLGLGHRLVRQHRRQGGPQIAAVAGEVVARTAGIELAAVGQAMGAMCFTKGQWQERKSSSTGRPVRALAAGNRPTTSSRAPR